MAAVQTGAAAAQNVGFVDPDVDDQAGRFELVVNLKTARTLVIALPPAILVRVGRVIEMGMTIPVRPER